MITSLHLSVGEI